MKKADRLFALLLVLTVLLSGLYLSADTAAAASKIASPTSAAVQVDGKAVPFQAYNIDGSNYFKLRDIAMALNGTQKQFSITYSSSANAMYLVTGEAYVPIGGELAGTAKTIEMTAMSATAKVFLNGEKLDVTAYNIDGSNYFKLRELGASINFSVGWDTAANTISVTTSKDYGPVIVYMSYMGLDYPQFVAARLKILTLDNNYRLIVQDVGSVDAAQTVQMYCDQKVSAIIMNVDPRTAEGVMPIATKAGIPLLTESADFTSAATGRLLTSGVNIDPYKSAGMCAQWMVDNGSSYGLTVGDQSKLGFLVVTNSGYPVCDIRVPGAVDKIKSVYPDCKLFYADTADAGNQAFSPEAQIKATSAVLSVHPEIEIWYIYCVGESFAQSADKAVQEAKLDKKAIITSIESTILTRLWRESDYNGSWKACCYYNYSDFADALLPALDAVVKGNTPASALFPDERLPGETFAIHHINVMMLDKQAYKEMISK